MSRGRKRKTDKGSFSEEAMRSAVKDVIEKKKSIRQAAREYELKVTTLHRYVAKAELSGLNIRMAPKYKSRQVFTEAEEMSLKDYMIQCSKMCYGKSTKVFWELAYEMAKINKKNIPDSWEVNKKAGLDWMQGFLKRHPTLSIRQPEGCSLSRATAFNKYNVSKFYENLKCALDRSEKFSDGTRIYNLDETGTTTVQKPKKIIAQKGIKQVSQCTSAERGDLVTTCCIISASGNSLPPAMVFPRKNFKEHMINGAPPGTLGLATSTGWMNGDLFVLVMNHFIKFSGSSIESPTILIMDNHESHLTIEALNIAKNNGVTILTIPPHCSNKLQPLDITVYAPFKAHYNAAVDPWLLHHPGMPMTIYQVAHCVGIAHERALTPSNIKAGFRAAGIFPFDDNIFTDDDFLTSYVTDRINETAPPLPINVDSSPTVNETINTNNANVDSIPKCSTAPDEELPNDPQDISVTPSTSKPYQDTHSGSSCSFITPDVFKGFPKAAERKKSNRGRAKGYSCIATDTPEKDKIEQKFLARQAKKMKPPAKRINKALFVRKKRRELEDFVSSSSEDELHFSSDEELADSSSEEVSVPTVNPDSFKSLDRELVIGDFVLVQFEDKLRPTRKVFYVAEVMKQKDPTNEVEVSFLRKSGKFEGSFTFPIVRDVSMVGMSDIKMILPTPKKIGTTKRLGSFYNFHMNFNLLNIN